MQADLPHTLYLREKKGGKGGRVFADNYQYNPKDPAIVKTEESLRRRRERKENGDDGVTIEELFNKE